MFSYLSAEKRLPAEQPLRTIRTLVDTVLEDVSPAQASSLLTPSSPIPPVPFHPDLSYFFLDF
jgi:hypothetical protein